MIRNYVFAALDFIVSKQDEIYFIEANSSPGVLKRYEKVYNHCKPVEKLCDFLNKRYKKMAVITNKNWEKSVVSNVFRKRFKGDIYVCDYEENKGRMLKGDGSLVDKKGQEIMPDVILKVVVGRPHAQKKAGIKIINSLSVLKITQDKLKTKEIVQKNVKIKVPKAFVVNKKSDIKKILNKNVFSHGFVLKPQKGHKSHGVFICDSYDEIPKDFVIDKPYILEECIYPCDLFKGEFFEIRSMAVNGKYAGAMLFVSPKRPMHLTDEGRVEKIPKFLEKRIKIATEEIVKAIEAAS